MQNLIITTALAMLAASSVAQPLIDYGAAECAHCRRSVEDAKFGAAILTVKGRTYAFDAPACMVHFAGINGYLVEEEVAGWYVTDFAHPGTLIDATKAFYLYTPMRNGTMQAQVSAFATAADRKDARKYFPGEDMDWAAVRKEFADE